MKSPAHKTLLPRATVSALRATPVKSSGASTGFLSHPAGGIARRLSKVKKMTPQQAAENVLADSSEDKEKSWIAEITEGEKLEFKTDTVPAWFNQYVLEKIR